MKKRKYRGQTVLTLEELHQILGLPEEVELSDVIYDSLRERVHLKIQSEKPVHQHTFETGASQEVLRFNLKSKGE